MSEMRRHKAVIVALERKAAELRRVANDLNVEFTESVVPGEHGVIRFTFELSDEESLRLARLVPQDVYARRAYLR